MNLDAGARRNIQTKARLFSRNGVLLKGVDILWSKHPIYAGLDIDKRRESAVRKEIMGAEINWKGRELVLLVVAVSGTRSNAELLVDKPLVKIIGPYKQLSRLEGKVIEL